LVRTDQCRGRLLRAANVERRSVLPVTPPRREGPARMPYRLTVGGRRHPTQRGGRSGIRTGKTESRRAQQRTQESPSHRVQVRRGLRSGTRGRPPLPRRRQTPGAARPRPKSGSACLQSLRWSLRHSSRQHARQSLRRPLPRSGNNEMRGKLGLWGRRRGLVRIHRDPDPTERLRERPSLRWRVA